MVYRVDEKGKFFTQQIHKDPILVTVWIEDTQVRGTFHLTPASRLKDELNNDESFIAITQARVSDKSDRLLFETDVLIVNKQRITWIYPSEPAT